MVLEMNILLFEKSQGVWNWADREEIDDIWVKKVLNIVPQ